MNNLANSYVNEERFQEAADLRSRVVEIRTRVLGRSDPLTIAAMDMLGGDYRGLGRLNRAIQLQEDAVSAASSSLGAAHETTVKCMMNLAGTYKSQGTDEGTARQVALLEEAYRSLRRTEEEDNPLTIALMNNLGLAYTRTDRPQDARALLVSCHEWNHRTYGPGHPRTQASRQNLEFVMRELGELTRAPIF
jgi:tetratricopeptide (TPR) repeat protein